MSGSIRQLQLLSVLLFCLLFIQSQGWCFYTEISQANSVDVLDYSPDNIHMIAVSITAKIVNIWDLTTNQVVYTYVNNSGQKPTSAKFTKAGASIKIAISYWNGQVHIISGTTPFAYISTIASGMGRIVQVDFSWTAAQNLLICSGNNNNYVIYYFTNSSLSGNIGTSNNVVACKFDQNGGVSVISNKFEYFSAGSTNPTQAFNGNFGDIDVKPSTVDVRMLAVCSASGSGLTIGAVYQSYSTNNSKNVIYSITPTPSAGSFSVCYSKDANWFAYGGTNGITYIFNATSNNFTNFQDYRDSTASIVSCRFSYDNLYLAVGDSTGTIFIYSSSCLTTLNCAQGFYFASSICNACAVSILGCWTCTSSSVCTDCYEGYYLLANSNCSSCSSVIEGCKACQNSTYCYQCNIGYWLNTTYSTNTNICYNCESYTNGCMTCSFNGTSPYCLTCNLQYYLNSTDNLCYLCNINNPFCIRCLSSAACIQCQPGLYISGTNCVACPTNCLICTNSSYCLTCKKGYYANSSTSNLCSACSFGCLDCYSTSLCIACYDGLYLTGAGACSNCSLPCLTCNSTSNCFSCASGYYPSGSSCLNCSNNCISCLNISYCQSCEIGYYLVSNNSCLACQISYSQCSSCNGLNCISCSYGYYLNATYLCTLCSISINGCLTCMSNAICTHCLVGYYLVTANSTCSLCSSICQSCLTSSYCYHCLPGYYLNAANACLNCSVNCITCTSNTNCTSCTLGYYLSVSGGSYICSACSISIIGCLTCSTSSVCTSCEVGKHYISSNNTCGLCPSNCTSCLNSSSCMFCAIGYYLDTTSICYACPSHCSYCTSNSTCATCNIGYYLSVSSCLTCSTIPFCITCNITQCFTCQDGYYLANPTTCAKCLSALTNCLSCVNATSCSFCDFGYYLSATNSSCSNCSILQGCINCYSSTNCSDCLAGYYLLANATCAYCPNKCQTCTSSTTCLLCNARYIYDSLPNDCILCEKQMQGCQFCNTTSTCMNCLIGYYLSSTSCMLCSSTVVGCLSCNSSLLCIGCQQGYYLASNTCKNCELMAGCELCNSSSICLACSNGYYLSSNSCLLCTSIVDSCVYCSNATSCLLCKSSFYLNGGNCLQCAAAISGCILCNSQVQCIQCSGAYFLNSTTMLCQSCPTVGCSLCLESNSTTCLNCNFNYYLLNSACLSCSTSLIGCLQCRNATTCTICQSNYYLLANHTCNICSLGVSGCNKCNNNATCLECQSLYYLNGSGICISCSVAMPQCIICTSVSQCSDCVSGYYLDSNMRCEQCSNKSVGCFICTSNVCLGCSPGYYLVNDTCNACSSVVTNCYTCIWNSPTISCLSCSSGYLLTANGRCQVIKLEGSAPQVIPELTMKTSYSNATTLQHTLSVQNYYYVQNHSLNLSTSTTISLFNTINNTNTPLIIATYDWGDDGYTLIFYTDNPLNLTSSSFTRMPLTRMLLTVDDFSLSFKTKFTMTKDALISILPELILTQDFSIDTGLASPSFYASIMQNESDNLSYNIIGYVGVGLLFVMYFLKAACTMPKSDDLGEIIPHIFCVRTCALMVFPVYPQMINYCTGWMAADIPWLTTYYDTVLSNSADVTPFGYLLFYKNMNFACMYLSAFIILIILLIIVYIANSSSSKSSQTIMEEATKLQQVSSKQSKQSSLYKFLFNFFSFGLIFSSCSSMVGAIFNPISSFTVNSAFYIIGIVIYILSFGYVIYRTTLDYKTKNHISNIRILVKVTIISIAHVSPIYVVTFCSFLDVMLAIIEYCNRKQYKYYPRLWLCTHIVMNLNLIALYYFSDWKITLYINAAIIFAVICFELFLHIQEICHQDQINEKIYSIGAFQGKYQQSALQSEDQYDWKHIDKLDQEWKVQSNTIFNQSKTTFQDTAIEPFKPSPDLNSTQLSNFSLSNSRNRRFKTKLGQGKQPEKLSK